MDETTTPSAAPAPGTTAGKGQRGAPARARQDRALSMRIAGASLSQIATACSYSDKSAASKAVDAALAREVGDLPARRETYRMEQTARLERMLLGIYGKAIAGDPQAVAAALRVMERQARLLGLDAPTRVVVTDQMDAEIEALLEETSRLERLAAAQADAAAAAAGEG